MVDEAMQDCIDVFGEGAEQVTVAHGAGTPYAVNGIFDSESLVVDPETRMRVVSNQPVISFKVSDMEQDPDSGDTVVIRGRTYTVVEPTFDGQGTVTLRLHLA
jgi:hypothetical protein